jgi:hypothetical protein
MTDEMKTNPPPSPFGDLSAPQCRYAGPTAKTFSGCARTQPMAAKSVSVASLPQVRLDTWLTAAPPVGLAALM